MSAAPVLDIRVPGLFFDEWTVARVRQARHQLNDTGIAALVGWLEHLDRAVSDGNLAGAERIIARCPPGRARDCLAAVAGHHLRGRQYQQITTSGPQSRLSTAVPTPRRSRPYTELRAMCAPTDVWANTGQRWLVIDPDCFAGTNTRRFAGHRPVGLQWRHGGKVIGLSRQWSLDNSGALHGEFWLPPTTEAQMVAQAAADRLVAPSIGVRFESDWTHPSPDEWDPHGPCLDVCRHIGATVEEVSLTPTPQLPTAIEWVG